MSKLLIPAANGRMFCFQGNLEERMNEKPLRKIILVFTGVIATLIGASIIAAPLFGIPGRDVFGGLGSAFADAPLLMWSAAVLVVLGSALSICFAIRKPFQIKADKWSVREIVTGALCIGLAFILSFVRILRMPQGGSITPASMLPIMLYAYIYGMPKGLIAAAAFGTLQFIQDPAIVHWAQIFLDYGLAFMILSVAGLFRKSILPGVILGGIGRLFFAVLSGIVFFAEYAPAGQSIILYSIGYNASYLLPEIGICLLIVSIPAMKKSLMRLKNTVQSRNRT